MTGLFNFFYLDYISSPIKIEIYSSKKLFMKQYQDKAILLLRLTTAATVFLLIALPPFYWLPCLLTAGA
jgi:hypothetical protein